MANASKLSARGLQFYAQHRTGFTRGMYATFFGAMLLRVLRPSRSKSKSKSTSQSLEKAGEAENISGSGERPKKVAIDGEFFSSLLRLLRIVFPGGIKSKEFWLIFAESIALVLRTGLSLYVARLDGQIVSNLVKGEGRQFALSLVWWMVVGFPASFTNSILAYLQRTIALRFRTRLNEYMLKRYLPDSDIPVYYSLHNLDDRVKNADQVITADVTRFSNAVSNLYSNLAKPVLDMTIYTWQLSKSIGADNVFFIGLAIQLSAGILRASAPPFGEFVAEEASLEGDFRSKHTRLIDYSEEVALYRGHAPEKDSLDRSYFALFKHMNRVLRHRLYYNFMEDFVVKYYWGALGMLLCSIPVFFKNSAAAALVSSVGERTQSFVTNRRLLLSASDAFGRIMSSYKEVSQLAGYTSRVSNFIDVMDDMAKGRFEKKLIGPTSTSEGTVRLGHDIVFDKVPIVSPVGDVLVRDLSFQVKQGQHLLIVGPNGSGKSSLFRILGGLWQIQGGTLTRPPPSDIFYIPQRPYLSRGSLRQQIIYPTIEENNTTSDAELREILDVLKLGDLVDHVGGWDAEREWREDFSMGVQQRIAAARLFYHRPKFAILDECTSSVTLDIETIIYTHAKSLGISLLTVSHRASLWQYHNLILQFDGYGGYIFSDLDAEARLKLEKEKLALDQELRQEEDLKERLQILEQSLLENEDAASPAVPGSPAPRAAA